MKHLLYILGILVTLSSCSLDDIKDVASAGEIKFRVVTSKAVEVNSANFEEFQVTALYSDGVARDGSVKYFEDVYEKTGSYFASPNKYEWISGASLDFYAYYPYGETLPGTLDVDNKVLKGFTSEGLLADQVDFVSAKALGYSATSSAVGLEFEHNLAQVEVRGRNTSDGYVCKVFGIIFGGIYQNGDFDFNNSSWDLYGKGICGCIYTEPITLGHEPISLMGIALDGSKVVSDNAMLLPQELIPWQVSDTDNKANGALIYLLVQIRTVTGVRIYPTVDMSTVVKEDYKEYDFAALPISGTWEAGTKYIYTWDMPKVGGYVYPGKAYPVSPDVFKSGDPIMGTQIRALTPTVAPWNSEVENILPVPEPEVEKNEADLVGTWNVDRMTLTVTKGDDDIQVLEMPSPQAIESLKRLPEVLYVVEFDNNKNYKLNGGAEGAIGSDEGNLYLPIDDVGKVVIKDWSESQMCLYMKYVPQDEEDVVIEYQAYYLKDGATKKDLRDWEKYIEGVWDIASLEVTVILDDGTELPELGIFVGSYEEIVNNKELMDDWFYELTFISPYEWHFNNHVYENGEPVISSTLLLNDTLSLYLAISDESYTMQSLYDAELISPSEMIISAAVPYEKDDDVGTVYTYLTYRKK